MDCPLDYSLCDKTVTVYRMENGQLQRQVVDGCYYFWQAGEETDALGTRQVTRFLLIMPGQTQRVFPGDRIYDGVGPENVDWPAFLPVNVAGLSQVAYVRPTWWDGRVCHVEAGRK